MEKFVIVIDTETTNNIDDPICYDIGWSVVDPITNEVIVSRSFVVADIFLDKELMSFAYFIDKMPMYQEDIKNGKRQLKRFANIKKAFKEDFDNYEVEKVFAHNVRFDYRSTNTTQRFLTGSKYRYFFPKNAVICDTLKMARQLLAEDETYTAYCKKHGFVTKYGKPQFTAEVLYRFIHQNENFVESHTALEDVLIEKDILHYCLMSGEDLAMKLWGKE